MNYCSQCSHPVNLRIPTGDNRARFICDNCQTIHYQNPRIVAGSLPVWKNQVLLCKRAIEPRKGYWTLPAGFMENEESTEQAAKRETWEEALAKVELTGLYTMITVPHISQVHLFFLADMTSEEFNPGPESLEVKLFDEKDIPWSELAFPTVSQTLKHFFADRKTQQYPTRVFDIDFSQRLKT